MQALGTVLAALADGLRSGSPHTTGDRILERVDITLWLTGFRVGGSTLTPDHEHSLFIWAGAYYFIDNPAFVVPTHDPDPRVTRLIGHASRTGNEDLNRQFGLDRATSVLHELQDLGVESSRLPAPETKGSQGDPPTHIARTLGDLALGAEIPEHRAVEIAIELTISRPRLDTIDWEALVEGTPISPSRARDFWNSYGSVTTDVATGSASVVLEVLGMFSATAGFAMAAGAAVTVVGAVALWGAVIVGFAQAHDNSVKTYRLWAMAFQATDWVMESRFFVSLGPIPRPDQPERFWKTVDIPEPYADDRDREKALERRQNWREGADMMQNQLREVIEAQDAAVRAQMDPARAAQLEIQEVEQTLRYAIRRNASGDPDRLATGQEVLDSIYSELRAAVENDIPGLRTELSYPSASFR